MARTRRPATIDAPAVAFVHALRLLWGRRYQARWDRLNRHTLLADYPVHVRRRVASIADEAKVPAGYVLAKQGCHPEWFFLVHEGEAEVDRDGCQLAVIGPGEHFGEVALVGRGLHPATVRARTAMTLSVVAGQRFLPLVEDVKCLRWDMEAALVSQSRMVRLAREERSRCLRPPSPVAVLATTDLATPRTSGLAATLRGGSLGGRRRGMGLRALIAVFALAVLAPVAAAATLYHPPYAVITPGPAFDVSRDMSISGVPVHPARGRYLLVTARTQRPTLLGVGVAMLHRDRRVVPVARLVPKGLDEAEVRQRLALQFAESQTTAAAAAARADGMAVSSTGRLPFTVRFRSHDVIGPSAGLVYALAIEDMLSATDRGRGRSIAATGEIDPTGAVSAVGDVSEKAETARRAGANLLLVPQSQIQPALEGGVLVDGVASLDEALADLGAGSSDRR